MSRAQSQAPCARNLTSWRWPPYALAWDWMLHLPALFAALQLVTTCSSHPQPTSRPASAQPSQPGARGYRPARRLRSMRALSLLLAASTSHCRPATMPRSSTEEVSCTCQGRGRCCLMLSLVCHASCCHDANLLVCGCLLRSMHTALWQLVGGPVSCSWPAIGRNFRFDCITRQYLAGSGVHAAEAQAGGDLGSRQRLLLVLLVGCDEHGGPEQLPAAQRLVQGSLGLLQPARQQALSCDSLFWESCDPWNGNEVV